MMARRGSAGHGGARRGWSPVGAETPTLLDSAFYIFLHLRTKRSLRNAFANERDESRQRT